ncbi:MAG: quinol monooxygenase YgiN [Ancylomarina sp.]|jgi:quinol monooxygenase YgiN
MDIIKNESQLVCIAKFMAIPGKVNELIKNLHALIPLTLQEGGCIRYELHQCIDDENRITFIEKWHDEKTFKEHSSKPYLVEFFNEGKPLYVKEFEVTMHKEILK